MRKPVFDIAQFSPPSSLRHSDPLCVFCPLSVSMPSPVSIGA